MIVILCGPPGTGKTTVARGLERRLADEFRDRQVRRFDSDEFSSRTYERLGERVAAAARGGSNADDSETAPPIVLVAGTFYRREWREAFRALPATEGVRFVRLEARLETCLERNRERADPIDEAGVHVVYREFEPFGADGEPAADLRIETDDLSPAAAVDRIAEATESWLAGAASG